MKKLEFIGKCDCGNGWCNHSAKISIFYTDNQFFMERNDDGNAFVVPKNDFIYWMARISLDAAKERRPDCMNCANDEFMVMFKNNWDTMTGLKMPSKLPFDVKINGQTHSCAIH